MFVSSLLRSATRKTVSLSALPKHSFSTAAVSASVVKELRDKTGAPMMDCKKALSSPDVAGDMAKAVDWLRAKGKARAASGADRVASEGLVAWFHDDALNKHTLIEVNSETDFVSRNKDFQAFVATVCSTSSSHFGVGPVNVAELLTKPAAGGSLQDVLSDAINVIRENLVIRRVLNVTVADPSSQLVAGYVHGKVGQDVVPPSMQLGKSLALVQVSVEAKAAASEDVAAAGKKLAMHVVAAVPQYLNRAAVPADVADREMSIFRDQAVTENAALPPNKARSQDMLEKVIAGKVSKRLGEICLLSQNHVAEEGAPTIEKHLAALSSKVGGAVTVTGFHHWTLGQTN